MSIAIPLPQVGNPSNTRIAMLRIMLNHYRNTLSFSSSSSFRTLPNDAPGFLDRWNSFEASIKKRM